MFTGLVADLGTVTAVDSTPDGVRLNVKTSLAGELSEGDSVAVNGVCLTATAIADAGRNAGFNCRHRRMTRSTVLGCIAGLTFGVAESVKYVALYLRAGEQGGASVPVVLAFSLRVFLDGFQHAVWAGISGFFIGMGVNYRRRRVLLIAIGISIPAVLHGLSDPARLEIVRMLAAVPERPCTDFHGLGGLTVPTLSHHLRVLREAGLTRTRIDGRRRYLSLRREDLECRFPGVIDPIISSADSDSGSLPSRAN